MKAVALLALALLLPATMAGAIGTTRIEGHSFGYVMPVTVVPSGASVVWGSIDTIHVTTDGLNAGDADHCFTAIHNSGDDSDPIVFTLSDGVVYADDVECLNTRALDGGAVAVPFYCTLHPTMRGTLVVTG